MSESKGQDITRVLEGLARRADEHVPQDRLTAVHRRVRRAARVRVAIIAAGVVLVGGGAGVLWQIVAGDLESEPAVTVTEARPHLDVTLSQVTDPAIVAAAAAPYKGSGASVVVVQVRMRGQVPETHDRSRRPFLVLVGPAPTNQGPIPDVLGCSPDAPLVPVDEDVLITYRLSPAASGTADVEVRIRFCPSRQDRSYHLTVQVPAPS
jgi:hypothetical protein